MNLFSLFLQENSKSWFRDLLEKNIKTWTQFHNAFINQWVSRKVGRLFLTQFHEIKKKDYETIQEFDQIFDGLVKLIPKYLNPPIFVILFQYTNAFLGQFGFVLRDKLLDY
jgi:hypothetical protein